MLRLLARALLSLPLLLAPGPDNPGLAETASVPVSREQIQLSFAPVVKQVAPAVVNIFSRKVVEERRVSPLFDDPLFKRFFGEDFGLFGMPRERIQNSLGSGVIVTADGLVVTNHHVIGDADEITVVLSDRREFPAERVLDDERSDLAVLRIDPKGEPLPTVALRDSDEVEVGDLVLAIGNPFGVGQTVTSGIVSGLARTGVGISDYSFFIQTDAAINPGNSGGALVTLDGKLLGINTAIYSRTGGSIGIGFAIPANMVRTVINSALSGGEIQRAWTGLVGEELTNELAARFGLDRPQGVVVNRVFPGGPAADAGIIAGDVILSVDGRPVDDMQSLRFRIATGEIGGEAEVGVWRDRDEVAVELPLATAPETPPRNETTLRGSHPLAGAQIANLSPALAEEIEMPGAWEGVIVLDIVRGSTAHRVGFRHGDILLAVDNKKIGDVVELAEIMEQRVPSWTISFSREGQIHNVTFKR